MWLCKAAPLQQVAALGAIADNKRLACSAPFMSKAAAMTECRDLLAGGHMIANKHTDGAAAAGQC
jgi:hypothetical protein